MAKVCHTTQKNTSSQRRLSSLQYNALLPYGAILQQGGPNKIDGVQFSVFSRHATAMRVLLYETPEDIEPVEVISFDPIRDRWGDIWSIFIPDLKHGQLYHFQADGPFNTQAGHRFDPTARLVDPYSKALAGHFLHHDDGIIRPPKSVVIDDSFDWEGDRHLNHGLADTIIYELHIRGFTAPIK